MLLDFLCTLVIERKYNEVDLVECDSKLNLGLTRVESATNYLVRPNWSISCAIMVGFSILKNIRAHCGSSIDSMVPNSFLRSYLESFD
jgi:hypothetical protein